MDLTIPYRNFLFFFARKETPKHRLEKVADLFEKHPGIYFDMDDGSQCIGGYLNKQYEETLPLTYLARKMKVPPYLFFPGHFGDPKKYHENFLTQEFNKNPWKTRPKEAARVIRGYLDTDEVDWTLIATPDQVARANKMVEDFFAKIRNSEMA